MTRWVQVSDEGEVVGTVEGDCPLCEDTRQECDMLLTANERDLRSWKLRATKAEKRLEAQTAERQNKKEWEAALEEWLRVFPDVPRPRSTSVKSARAQEFFARLGHGAQVEDVLDAIHGARERPYLVYGKRSKAGAGGGTTRAVDLADICAVKGTHADANFDLLCAEGAKLRRAVEPAF